MLKWIKRHEWDIVSVAAVLGFGLGLFGFASFLSEAGKSVSFFAFLYFGFRLFLFNYDLPGDGVPYATPNTALEIARFLTPATVFYAAIRGVAVSLAQQLSLWKCLLSPGGYGKSAIVLQGAIARRSRLPEVRGPPYRSGR